MQSVPRGQCLRGQIINKSRSTVAISKASSRPWVIVAVTVQVSTLMLLRKIDTVFVHHGYPHPLTHQRFHRICTDLKIDPREGWGVAAPNRGDATDYSYLYTG